MCSEHGEFNPRVADHLYGSGCPLCAPKGFDKGAPGVFYVYEISHLGQDYIGYGITGNLEQRDKAHQTTFKSHGAVGTLLKTFTFESGESCAELETSVKEHFSLFTTGMDGFKTESTHLHNLEKLLNYALSWKSRSA